MLITDLPKAAAVTARDIRVAELDASSVYDGAIRQRLVVRPSIWALVTHPKNHTFPDNPFIKKR